MIKLYCIFFKINLKRLSVYKLDFFFNLSAVLIWVSVGLITLFLVYHNQNTFSGWSFSESVLLYGMWSLTFAIYNAFAVGILDIEDLIMTGDLNLILAKPVNPLFLVVTRRINTMGLGFLIFGFVVISLVIFNFGFTYPFLVYLYLLFSAILGGMLIFASYLILACINFWILKANSTIRIGYDIHKLAQYPLNIYGGLIKFLLVFILPYAFTNYFPVSIVLNKIDYKYLIIQPIVCITVFILSIYIWNRGLKKYEGTGS